ncbi:MAG: RNA methyltransferase [Mesorhizobium sp.]
MTSLIRIDDAADPRLAAYRDIRERDLVGRQGRFVAEGRVVLNVLFDAARFEAESVLFLENRVDGSADLIARIPASVPVYVASQTVMDALAGFHMHRGILAIGRRREDETVADLLGSLPQESLVVALSGISNHDNMGAIFRNAAAFGAGAALLDPTCCDPLYRKAIRVSVGSTLKTPYAFAQSLEDMVTALVDNGFELIALSPQGEETLGEVKLGPRRAILLGSEGHGLPHAVLARLRSVRIPIVSDFDSLNVAAASAIALHHLSGLD